ncbi:MAG TPA: flagellar biosynthesis protein FlgK [Lachnospiraceae bacterium]|nr:flagellar biosynthesis protein FlgK [Lachnospiraceae bacterium]
MVRATFAGFSTALSALQANQKRLDIIGQNLSNMNTPGYTRQSLETSSINYRTPVSNYMNGSEVIVGFGVSMDKVTQIRDPYLDAQYRNQMQKSGYTDSIQSSLDRLSKVFDESSINGINSAFNDIYSTLVYMHDNPKANDAIYEAELQNRMKALTNLLNDADRHITESERIEYTQLDGRNNTENGAVQEVNDILMQIGNLNRQIKQNQVLGQQSLELMDERNLLLDELSSYIPIEVTYYKDKAHDGVENGTEHDAAPGAAPEEEFYLDRNGNPLGKKEWPDDLRVEMLYTDANGQTHKLTLVEGTEGTGSENYGHLSLTTLDATKEPYPDNFSITFTGSAKNLADTGETQETLTLKAKADGGIEGTATDNGQAVTANTFMQLKSGSIQASLDMLWKNNGKDLTNANDNNDIRGYEYYRQELDKLAKGFADVMNNINIYGTSNDPNVPKDEKWYLLANKENNTRDGITAGNIGINVNWVNGSVGVSNAGENPTDTLLNMMEAMVTTYPYGNTTTGTDAMMGANPDLKNNSFADFMNNISTTLANDSYSNTYVLKNNVTVLNAVQNARDSVSGVSLDEEASNMMMYQAAYNAASRLMTALDEVLNVLINSTGVCGR